MARSLALVSAALDGDRHAIGQLLAIVDRSLGDALVSADRDQAGAAGSAALLVLAAQSHLSGLVPPAGAVSAWPLRAVCDALALTGHGLVQLPVAADRRGDVAAATDLLAQAHAVLAAVVAR
jgi:hypothetical protein